MPHAFLPNAFLARNLRPILWFDAATCLVFGLGCIGLAEPLFALTGVPVSWLRGGGIICLLAAALILFTLTRPAVPAVLVRLIVALNLLWALASVLCVLLGWIAPNPLGAIAVIGQGAAVLAIAVMQHLALKGQAALQGA